MPGAYRHVCAILAGGLSLYGARPALWPFSAESIGREPCQSAQSRFAEESAMSDLPVPGIRPYPAAGFDTLARTVGAAHTHETIFCSIMWLVASNFTPVL